MAAIGFWDNQQRRIRKTEEEGRREPERTREIMASICLFSSKTLALPSAVYLHISSSSTSHSCSFGNCRCSFPYKPVSNSHLVIGRRRTGKQVVRMAPDEEKLTRRNPLDFPIVYRSLLPSLILIACLIFPACIGVIFHGILGFFAYH